MTRLPALLTCGDTLSEIGCSDYEISLCEPLHDLKNTISTILDEMPAVIEDQRLQTAIRDFCKQLTGKLTNYTLPYPAMHAQTKIWIRSTLKTNGIVKLRHINPLLPHICGTYHGGWRSDVLT